jgi:hypothetical protein
VASAIVGVHILTGCRFSVVAKVTINANKAGVQKEERNRSRTRGDLSHPLSAGAGISEARESSRASCPTDRSGTFATRNKTYRLRGAHHSCSQTATAEVFVFNRKHTVYTATIAVIDGTPWLVMIGLDDVMETAFAPGTSFFQSPALDISRSSRSTGTRRQSR